MALIVPETRKIQGIEFEIPAEKSVEIPDKRYFLKNKEKNY